jgi:hypothetical protein
MRALDEPHELLSRARRAIGGIVRVVEMRAGHLHVLRCARTRVRVRRRRQHGGYELRHQGHYPGEGAEAAFVRAQSVRHALHTVSIASSFPFCMTCRAASTVHPAGWAVSLV